MPNILPFEEYTDEYEKWFINNKFVYEAELLALKKLIPNKGLGIEIGVGSGRFAAPLGIRIGVEPSANMRTIARKRGIQVIDGVAENLPLKKSEFSVVLMVTTVCFLDNVNLSFNEAWRILQKGGLFIVGIVDRESPIGQIYLKYKNENVFYKEATFFTVDEVVNLMKRAGFNNFSYKQTIFNNLSEINDNEPITNGYGKGSFVAICGKK